MESTVIIAHRRRGQDYWDGYSEKSNSEAKKWIDYYRSLGRIAKIFPNIIEYRADCEKRLDKWEAKRTYKRRAPT